MNCTFLDSPDRYILMLNRKFNCMFDAQYQNNDKLSRVYHTGCSKLISMRA